MLSQDHIVIQKKFSQKLYKKEFITREWVDKMQTEQVIKRITTIVMNKLNEIENCKIQIGVSNRHVHVSKEDLEILFGKGYELTKKADLKQLLLYHIILQLLCF